MNNKFYTVCGIVEKEGKILFVRHTYGTAKDRILLPGGYVMQGELPTSAVEREILEETGVKAEAKSILAMQFKPEQWCVVFVMEYVSGVPESDGMENSEVLLLTAQEAIARTDITNMSREIIELYKDKNYAALEKNKYIPESSTGDNYILFGNK